MQCLQIAIFTLDTVKITKRFACANKQRTQQTGALPTELTRQWSNLGSGSHGQLFCLWKTLWWAPPPPQRFDRLRRLCCLDTLRKIPFFMGTNYENIEVNRKVGPIFYLDLSSIGKKKDNKSAFESEQKHYVSLENYFSKKLSDMTRVSVSVSNFVNMRGVNPLDFSVSFKHTVLPFFASFGRFLRELLPQE